MAIELNAEEYSVILSALEHAKNHLVNRDTMNAELHLSAVRLSPLTVMVQDAYRLMRSLTEK